MNNPLFEIKKLQYMECDKGVNHSGELLNVSCIDQDWDNKGLICSTCEEEDHQTHQIIPLKIFMQDIKSLQEKETNN